MKTKQSRKCWTKDFIKLKNRKVLSMSRLVFYSERYNKEHCWSSNIFEYVRGYTWIIQSFQTCYHVLQHTLPYALPYTFKYYFKVKQLFTTLYQSLLNALPFNFVLLYRETILLQYITTSFHHWPL